MRFRIAPGGTAKLAESGLALRDRETGLPVDECAEAEAADPGSVLFGMRAGAPGKQVPGTLGGYSCARCSEGIRLAPSGQRMVRAGVTVWCVECLPFFGAQA